MRTAVLSSAIVFAVSSFAIPAQAQMICGMREDMGKMLDQRFAEQPKAAGIAGDKVVELLVSENGSWTILITGSDGRSCVVTGGEEWIEKPVQSTKAKSGKST